jgi:hypothetical protein
VEENWQESFVLMWHDSERGVGGAFRLGHEPNLDGGMTQFIVAIAAPEGIFHRCRALPLRPADRLQNGFANGDDSLRYVFDGEHIRWTLRDDDVQADLCVECYVPAIDVHRGPDNANAEAILSAHVDAACAVTGTMIIKGKTYRIDALGVRDHAWGTRDLASLLSHRWAIATFGRKHSFVAMTFLSTANKLVKFGWVIREESVLLASSVNVQSIIGEDGATNFGGTVRMTLTTDEFFEAKFDPLYPAIANTIQNSLYYDTLSRVTWGDHIGFGVFETSGNIQGGTLKPQVFDGSVGAEGWHTVSGSLLD